MRGGDEARRAAEAAMRTATATRAVLVLAGAAMVAASAVAQPLSMPPGRWWERPRIASEIGLSDEQRSTLDGVVLDHAKAMVDLKADVEKAELDLRGAADREPFDAKSVRSAFAALLQKRTRLEQERFELLLRVREVLTAEQWKKLTRFVRDRPMRGEGDDAGPGGPGGPRGPQRPRDF
jgi:Spy/CpxP family protein refolding chaperone